LITPPNPPPGLLGDYIFAGIPPGQTDGYAIRVPKTLPHDYFGASGTNDIAYPSGMLWMHAHVHMLARAQVQGGNAALLAIGDPLKIERVDETGAKSIDTLPEGTEVKYLALRDIQLATPHAGALPDPNATGRKPIPAQWVTTGSPFGDYDPKACAQDAMLPAQFGICGHAGVANPDGTIDPERNLDLAWLFTVNGQQYPDIELKPGGWTLLRLANMSSNITYLLQIADNVSSTPTKDDPINDLPVLSMDGVIAGANVDGAKYAVVNNQRILLMPAGRVDILVKARECGSQASLGTIGFKTSADDTGDSWPAIALARLRTPGKNCPPGGHALGTVDPLKLNYRLARATPEASRSRQGANAVSMMARKLTATLAPGVAPREAAAKSLGESYPGCVFLPANTYRRRITFKQDDVSFMLGSDVVDQSGALVADAHSHIEPAAFKDADWSQPHVCPTLGTTEVWELFNDTPETHNFHIHQSKFRLADSKLDPGAPAGLSAVVKFGDDCGQETDANRATAFCDPNSVLKDALAAIKKSDCTPEQEKTCHLTPYSEDSWHDTIPVPPGGHVFVSIPFKAKEQVGRYVFHCHILEHEDGGMMALVETLDLSTPMQASVAPATKSGAAPMSGMMPGMHHH
jgi:FtsP/CotA-like multicopper oxidase with cupredoxin domain